MSYLHKRVPDYMVSEYIERGWKIWKREATTVLLVWLKAGTPP